MADFLDEKRSEIAARLQELKPLVDEYTRLEAAVAALASVVSTPPLQRESTHSTTAGIGQRGRPKGSGKRANEALQLVKTTPGITILEIAEKIGIKQNYLYRVLSDLADAGLVIKQGRGWHSNNSADRDQRASVAAASPTPDSATTPDEAENT